MCTVRLRHTDKTARCRFFVVPGDGPTLLGMPYAELLGILNIMCEVVGDQHADRKSDFQTTQPFNGPNCKANKCR